MGSQCHPQLPSRRERASLRLSLFPGKLVYTSATGQLITSEHDLTVGTDGVLTISNVEDHKGAIDGVSIGDWHLPMAITELIAQGSPFIAVAGLS